MAPAIQLQSTSNSSSSFFNIVSQAWKTKGSCKNRFVFKSEYPRLLSGPLKSSIQTNSKFLSGYAISMNCWT